MNLLESLKYLSPEIILLAFSLMLLIIGLFVRKANVLGMIALFGVLLAAYTLPEGGVKALPLFSNLLVHDSFAVFFKEISLLVASLVILLSMGYNVFTQEDRGEYYFFLLAVTIGMLFAVSSNNLLMIYIAFELISLGSYVLVGFSKRDALSSEGALKYFLFGTFATGIMLYGISLIYGLFGTTDLSLIQAALATGVVDLNLFAVLLSLILILAGFTFKCGLIPFQMWIPDAYQGAPTPVTAFISIGPKLAGFAVLIRVFLMSFTPLLFGWVEVVTIIAIFTMTVGNIMALTQTNIKRMLGYSSIAQAGYIMIGFVVGTTLGIEGMMFYLVAYVLMNTGAFGCIILVSNAIKSDLIEDYAGLSKNAPFTAAMFVVFLLSLAGIPPMAGFLGKFFVFAAAIEAKFIFVAIVGIINSVIAVFYYARIIKAMYLEEPKTPVVVTRSLPLEIAILIALIGTLVIGLFPAPLLAWISGSLY